MKLCGKGRRCLFYRRLSGDRLWQDGFFDRVLRPDDDTMAIARYRAQNPVRAGLVSQPEEHPFTYGQPSVTRMLGLTAEPATSDARIDVASLNLTRRAPRSPPAGARRSAARRGGPTT